MAFDIMFRQLLPGMGASVSIFVDVYKRQEIMYPRVTERFM